MTPQHPPTEALAPTPVTLDDEPEVVLGSTDPTRPAAAPDAAALLGPRGAFLDGPDGPLYIADTGHHRVVVHRQRPREDEQPADFVLGQPDLFAEGRNARGADPSASTMNAPTGVCRFGDGIAVADAWNHRVLIWKTAPTESGQPADLILGQDDPRAQHPNRGLSAPRADTMRWPVRALVHDGRLYVADAGNRRVLVWRSLPEESGQPADFALGQASLHEPRDNAPHRTHERSLQWPHDLAVVGGHLAVADPLDHRVLVWQGTPDAAHAPARWVLGQADFSQASPGRPAAGAAEPSLNLPYGLAADGDRLVVADTANSRLVRFEPPLGSGTAGSPVAGPDAPGAHDAVRATLCWPHGLQLLDDLAVVSDTGNHRVLLWERVN